ncbi:hypothetical protein [Baia soyae]|uniref:Uncharacterized protein n=1 Tax=Baia soyae TaxID=1544746 RepID=A0A4R2RU81_9BACL|nr:hypothetical protein [Baia soyae]TCP66469.1 hypothetical protein EDD57_1236 [Baia soyae]
MFPNGPVKAFIYVTLPVGEIQAVIDFEMPITDPSELVGQDGIGIQEFQVQRNPTSVFHFVMF